MRPAWKRWLPAPHPESSVGVLRVLRSTALRASQRTTLVPRALSAYARRHAQNALALPRRRHRRLLAHAVLDRRRVGPTIEEHQHARAQAHAVEIGIELKSAFTSHGWPPVSRRGARRACDRRRPARMRASGPRSQRHPSTRSSWPTPMGLPPTARARKRDRGGPGGRRLRTPGPSPGAKGRSAAFPARREPSRTGHIASRAGFEASRTSPRASRPAP